MGITSFSFLLFVAAVIGLYYVFPKKWRWCLLLAASYFFYLQAGLEYLAFILFTTLSTYLATWLINRSYEKRDRFLLAQKGNLPRSEEKAYKLRIKGKNRVWLILCIVLNFAILALCKACLIEPFAQMAEGGRLSFLRLGLPLGISFYMFQSIGYVTDVYRETAKMEKNPLKLALFISFFPQLIQGPISSFSQIAPGLYQPHAFNGKELSFGLQRMLWGYFKKLVIADRIAVAVIALRGPEHTGVSFFLLTVFYAVQIYGDFTGGIDIALGIAQCLGIKLPENFDRPYFSKNIAEYWRRWHISLGVWMRAYIFYPISVSKPMRSLSKAARKRSPNFGKRLPVYVASLATWLVTGIWHGLSLNFIVWGLLNCFFIVLSEELAPLYEKFHSRFGWKERRWYGCFEILRMFVLMNLIRACDLFTNVGEYFRRIASLFTTFNFSVLWDGTLLQLGLSVQDYLILGAGVAVMFAVSLYKGEKGSVREKLWHKPLLLRYGLTFGLLLAVLLLGSYGIGYEAGNFIYNQF